MIKDLYRLSLAADSVRSILEEETRDGHMLQAGDQTANKRSTLWVVSLDEGHLDDMQRMDRI
ncbi:MAG: hypothetical protein OK474_06360 [Thaumarchaeota archaeon]|nr:hypothetical protein [Nitrososphaerota archaeon]